jgi:hypothetical protein
MRSTPRKRKKNLEKVRATTRGEITQKKAQRKPGRAHLVVQGYDILITISMLFYIGYKLPSLVAPSHAIRLLSWDAESLNLPTLRWHFAEVFHVHLRCSFAR